MGHNYIVAVVEDLELAVRFGGLRCPGGAVVPPHSLLVMALHSYGLCSYGRRLAVLELSIGSAITI